MNNWNVLILNTFEFKTVIFVDHNVPKYETKNVEYYAMCIDEPGMGLNFYHT